MKGLPKLPLLAAFAGLTIMSGMGTAQDLNCRGTMLVKDPPMIVSLELLRREGEVKLLHARVDKTPVVHGTLSTADGVLTVALEGSNATFLLPVLRGPGNVKGAFTKDGKRTQMGFNCRVTVPTTDTSPHTVRFIQVQPNVRLEVLDWGGTGQPIILLHGMSATAHDFDEFAPKLAAEYRVVAITRRASGRSSMPDTGYSAERLADDVLAVADSLGLVKPVLVGHSLGGADLSAVAARAPKRIAGLVYLDAGYPYAYIDSSRVAGFETKPEDMYKCPCSPMEQMSNGSRLYSHINAPVLAIFRIDTDWDTPIYSSQHPWTPAQQVAEFAKGVPTARVVRIEKASHYIFKSNEAQVITEMRAFIGDLQRRPPPGKDRRQ